MNFCFTIMMDAKPGDRLKSTLGVAESDSDSAKTQQCLNSVNTDWIYLAHTGNSRRTVTVHTCLIRPQIKIPKSVCFIQKVHSTTSCFCFPRIKFGETVGLCHDIHTPPLCTKELYSIYPKKK